MAVPRGLTKSRAVDEDKQNHETINLMTSVTRPCCNFTAARFKLLSLSFVLIAVSLLTMSRCTGFTMTKGIPRYLLLRGEARPISIIRSMCFNNKKSNNNGNNPAVWLETITSLTNYKVKLFQSLKTKKGRDQNQLVLVEGGRACLDALDSGLVPRFLFLTKEYAEAAEDSNQLSLGLGALILERATRSSDTTETHYITEKVLNVLTDTMHSQGVIAAFHKPQHFTTSLENFISSLSPQKSTSIVILDGVSDPGNMGTLIRSCYALGVDAIICINDCCDVWSPKVLRSSCGLQLRGTLPVTTFKSKDQLSDFLDFFKIHYDVVAGEGSKATAPFSTTAAASSFGAIATANVWPQVIITGVGHNAAAVATTPVGNGGGRPSSVSRSSSHSIAYDEVDYTRRASLIVLGSEAHGVAEATRQTLRSIFAPDKVGTVVDKEKDIILNVHIPMLRHVESFNVAIAGSILMVEIDRQRHHHH